MNTTFDRAAELAKLMNLNCFPHGKKEDILRELGRLVAESKKEGSTLKGWKTSESGQHAKAWSKVTGLKTKNSLEYTHFAAAWAAASVLENN